MKANHAGITDTSDVVQIFTDGACKGNPGIGGWGVKLVSKKGSRELYGGEQITTNNRKMRSAKARG